MKEKEYILTVDELALQIHRVMKDLYPSHEISGDDGVFVIASVLAENRVG